MIPFLKIELTTASGSKDVARKFVNSIKKELMEPIEKKAVFLMAVASKQKVEAQMRSANKWSGRRVAPLSIAWVKKKGHTINFLWKGLLYNALAVRKVSDGEEVYVKDMGEDRDEIASFLHYGGVRRLRNGKMYRVPPRPFFGLNEKSKDDIVNNVLPKIIDNVLKS